MFIAMNRFKVIKGEAKAFENVCLSRDTHLHSVPGLIAFHLLRAPDQDDHALHLLENDANDVDVLFTDVRMPGAMSGLDLARVAKRNWPGLRVIVTSGYFAGDFPSAEFLRKPWSASELVSRVAEAAA